jgi:PD-(D/E)XK nuclease superfamily protein
MARGKPANFRNHKERGEWTELQFMARTQELGFRVNKPYGDSAPYDVAVEEGGRFQRVQVKCTDHYAEYAYRSVFHSNDRRYTKEEVDFFAIYIIPEKVWYIFPAEVLIRLRFSVRLNPRNPKQKYARYLEAWGLLRDLGGQHELGAASTSVPGGEERKLCDAAQLPRVIRDPHRRRRTVCLAKTKRVGVPGFSALGCERLQRCVECYLARLMAGK